MQNILIKNGNIVNAEKNPLQGNFDILIEGNTIKSISENISEKMSCDELKSDDLTIIDAKDCVVMPAFVDMHVHLREPGYEYKEDIASGTLAAIHGGYSAVVPMPNTKPVVDDPSIVEYIKLKAEKANNCRVYPCASISKGLAGTELSEIGLLQEAGAIGFSDDGLPVSDGGLMRLAMQYSSHFDALLMLHCEDMSLSASGLMHEGYTSLRLGLTGIPPAAEESMIARDILLGQSYGARIHICHVSTARSVELIRQAKALGVKITCETAPHYFTATDEWVEQQMYDSNTKINPPLRSNTDRLAICKGLADGTIDAIATDHAPHHEDEKNVEFKLAASGIVGLETAFSLAHSELVMGGVLSPQQLVSKMSTNPAKILGLPLGVIKEGALADICIALPSKEIIYTKNNLHSKSKNTPFLDRPYFGKIMHTIVDGEVKF